jgi:SM-20-related protein
MKQISKTNFALDPSLDIDELRNAFHKRQRLRIPGILLSSGAEELYASIHEEVHWGLMLCAGASMGRQYASPRKCGGFTGLDERVILDTAYTLGGVGPSHIYDSVILSADDSELPERVRAFFAFLNSESFLSFTRSVTGIAGIFRVSAQVTRYRRGHFFGFHSDVDTHGKQQASIALNLSKGWMPQWGGHLQFRGSDGNVEAGYSPRFNSMNIFLPSLEHAVSFVSPAAAAPRYAIAAALMSR